MKKITIIQDNNPVLNYRYKYLNLPDSINTKELSELKKYVLSKVRLKSKEEPDIFFELMAWVSNQWDHNGWNAAPDSATALDILKSAIEDGKQYRCVEYGIVLNDILKSLGYPSRTIGLKNANVDYGGVGMGHVATEVWSNIYKKWIFLDPQFGIYAKKDNIPLNIYELYKLKSKNKIDEVKFMSAIKNKPNNTYWKKFLSNYLGYIDIFQSQNGQEFSIALKMEGERNYLTFQAFPSSKTVFTKNPENIYFPINQTMVIIDYTDEEKQRTQKEYSKLNVKSEKEYKKNMSLFAAKPHLLIHLLNNMPWFKNYIVKLNGKIIDEKEGAYPINLNEGLNTIETVAVNQAGIEGIPTVIKIKYGD